MKRSYRDRHENPHNQRKKSYKSDKPDNRNFCVAISRPKYCYETYEKAKRACQYSPNPQRIYYCKFCCAYHTTKMLDKNIFMLTKSAKAAEHMQAELAKRRERSFVPSVPIQFSDKDYRKREKMRCEYLHLAQSSDYNCVISDLLVSYYSVPGDEDIGKLSFPDFMPVFDSLVVSRTEKVDQAIAETLKYCYKSKADALVFFVLFYLKFCGGIVATGDNEDYISALFYSDCMSPRVHKKANNKIRQLIEDKMIVVTKMSSGYDVYSLGG